MSRPLRILHTADSHIGSGLPSRPRHDRPRRGDDLVDSFERVLSAADPDEIDLVLHAGDLFDTPRPSSRSLVAASRPLLNVAARGIPVVIVPGNHERSSIPSAIFLSHPNIHIVTEPTTLTFKLQGTRVGITSFPCLRKESARKFPFAMAETNWSKQRADLRILLVHQTFDSATCGPANFRFRKGDDVIPRADIPTDFDYIAAGHIHRHQTLCTESESEAPIVYAGSPDRVSFAEMDEPKGYVLVEEDDNGLSPTFVEHDVRPMSIHSIDVTDLSNARIHEHVEELLLNLPHDAIAQLRMTGSPGEDNLRGLRLSELASTLRPDVLFHVAARAVDFKTRSGGSTARKKPISVFAGLGSCTREHFSGNPLDLKFLPTSPGIYAMYDGMDRLLYIGKSKNLRTRVRSHFHDTNKGNHFGGWTQDVVRIEARTAFSDLEALLVEAMLIQKWSPPFNRQMRGSSRYCYLCENGAPYHQLAICAQPSATQPSFGPYRSRHQAQALLDALANHLGTALCPPQEDTTNLLPDLVDSKAARLCDRYYMKLCAGPCADQISQEEYARRIQQRKDLLQGKDDSKVTAMEAQIESQRSDDWREQPTSTLEREVSLLRSTFEYGQLLGEAESLLNGLLILPEGVRTRTIGFLRASGIQFASMDHSLEGGHTILESAHSSSDGNAFSNRRLPATSLDAFLLIVRAIRSDFDFYDAIPAEQLRNLAADRLVERAFG